LVSDSLDTPVAAIVGKAKAAAALVKVLA